MTETLADQLKRLCCAETEGKFFDCVTDNIDEIITALRTAPQAVAAAPVVGGETLQEALEPFVAAAGGIPNSVSNAAPFARVANDARAPGTVRTITVGEFRRLITALAQPASPLRGRDREQIAAVLYMARWHDQTWQKASLWETELAYKQADAILALASSAPPEQPAAAPVTDAISSETTQHCACCNKFKPCRMYVLQNGLAEFVCQECRCPTAPDKET